MLDLLFSHPLAFIIILGSIIVAIAVHEAAHCYVADYLGDPTPRSMGRLTLNPLAHLDPLGTAMIVVTGAFGWGKSSPYDPYNLRDPRRDTTWIALAGPASNILLAVILSLIFRIFIHDTFASFIFSFVIGLNINLALFNLLPIAPLDGSKLFSGRNPYTNQTSPFLLLLFIIPIFGGYSLASLVISPVSRFLLNILLP